MILGPLPYPSSILMLELAPRAGVFPALPFCFVTTLTGALMVGGAPAQNDVIEWRDGTTTRKAKVTEFTAAEIKFRVGGNNQTRGAHEARDLMVEKWQEALNRAGQDPKDRLGAAESEKDAFVAQALYHGAAEAFRVAADDNNMLECLRQLFEKYPRSGYAPEYFRRKVLFYMAKQPPRLKDAAAIAEKYGTACRLNAWNKAFELDAELWQKRAKAATKGANVDAFITELKDIVGRAGGVAEFVAISASADLADTYRKKKQYDEAATAYKSILEKKGVDGTTLARVYVGMGYIHLERALKETEAAKVKEEYHSAFVNFLKVYLNSRKTANAEIVGEGLYNAAKACEQWNGLPTCKRMAGLLRGKLKYNAPWKNTYWAKKKN